MSYFSCFHISRDNVLVMDEIWECHYNKSARSRSMSGQIVKKPTVYLNDVNWGNFFYFAVHKITQDTDKMLSVPLN